MTDKRKHRGAHPEDRQSFSPSSYGSLQSAVDELSWLLTRGYAPKSSLKIVGDRYQLTARQRNAVGRSSCGDLERDGRREKGIDASALRGGALLIDGFNVLTILESALSGGVVLAGRDGCYRDIASMHGNYRVLEETLPVLELLQRLFAGLELAAVHWYFDRPVSNSGRLKALLGEIVSASSGPSAEIELVPDPDAILAVSDKPVATSDSYILDNCRHWFNLARFVVDREIPEAWVVPLELPSS